MTANFFGKTGELHSLEAIAAGASPIHRLHPASKILTTFFFIATVVSCGSGEFSRLVPFLALPAAAMAAAAIPYPFMLKRFALALPFCLSFVLADAIFGSEPVFPRLAAGLISILLRAWLCVSAALILAATTPMGELCGQLRRFRVPETLVLTFEMTYRYLGTLADEARGLYAAYILRNGGEKGVRMRHMGHFAGGLLLRSFDRANRIHGAMVCRGFSLTAHTQRKQPMRGYDVIYVFAVCGLCLILRLYSIGPAPAAPGLL